MAASTPIRRPLATLNSNHALTSQGPLGPTKGTKKSIFVEKALPSIAYGGEATGKVEQDGRLDGKKGRNSDDDYDVRANKRQRRVDVVTEAEVQQYDQPQGWAVESALEKDETFGNHAEIGHEIEHNESLLSQLVSPSSEEYASSPASSENSELASPMATINDSQNTTVTVPDDDLEANWLTNSQSTIASRPLTTEEVRQKAREIRLRLSLANYKVRTNQMDVPISRLQIRSSVFPSRNGISGVSRVSRTPHPSTSIPNISLQQPSAEKIRLFTTSVPSSPASPHIRRIDPHRLVSPMKQKDATTEGLSTPLLPCQREGLLNPPMLGSPEEGRLTSSVVKGRAADGLLSLMRPHA